MVHPARAGLVAACVLAAALAGCVGAQKEEAVPASSEDPTGLPPPLAVAAQPAPAANGSAPAPAAPLPPDPVAPGPLEVARLAYDLGSAAHANVDRPSAYALRLRGSLHAPTGGEGPFPVVVLQHGRHATCAILGSEGMPVYVGVLGPAGHCPEAAPVAEPVDSHAGYDDLAENLASHGFVVASVDANGVNDLDGAWSRVGTNADAGAAARADLLLRTLDALARAHEGEEEGAWADALEGRLDLSRVGLMGHSRGGEGVTYAIRANAERPEGERHAIRAVFALAPIDANRVTAPGVAFATLLPYCDGDVWGLSGARIFDDTRATPDAFPKTQILVMGANHNYYNSVWTHDDAGGEGDPHCHEEGAPGEGRLTDDAQRLQGVAHMAAFFRLHLKGERAFAPLFDGTATLPPSACPDAAPCPRLAHVSILPPAGAFARLGLAAGTTGAAETSRCAPPDCKDGAYATGSAERLVVEWSGPATVAWRVPEGARDVARFDAFVLRVGADPAAKANAPLAAQDLRVELVDGAGRVASAVASAHSRALFVPPGGEHFRRVVLNDLRLPLAAFPGIDLGDVREARVVFDLTPAGRAHFGEAAFHGPFEGTFGG